MKRVARLLALVPLFAMIAAANATADGGKTVVVVNNTPYTVNQLYASGSDTSGWDTTNNLLAGQTVAPGQQTTITIADTSSECDYDLMAVLYGAAQYAYQYQVNACSGGTWTITQ